MLKEKGTIENGKMLTGYTNAWREIWKTIPQVTHTFNVGDRVISQYGKIGVVVEIDNIGKKLPYEWNSVLEVRILVNYAGRGIYAGSTVVQYPQDYAMQVLKKV